MAAASPTPMGSSHFGLKRSSSRHAFRQAPSRPNISRNGPIPISSYGTSIEHAQQNSTLNDSSDDELPMPPMKFSALTNALLNDEASILPPSPPANRKITKLNDVASEAVKHMRAASIPAAEMRRNEKITTPALDDNSPLPRRVVRLSGTPGSSTLRRAESHSGEIRRHNDEVNSAKNSPFDLITPAPVPRTVRIPLTSSFSRGAGSSGRMSQRANSGPSSGDDHQSYEDPNATEGAQAAISYGSVSRYGSSIVGRGRFGDETGMQSVMRPERLRKVAGTFMSGPARRGRRRQSEDEQEPGHENENEDGALSSQEPESQRSNVHDLGSSQESQEPQASSFYSSQADFASGSPIALERYTRVHSPHPILKIPRAESTEKEKSPSKPAVPVYRIPAPRPDLPSTHDQENEAPPTFKKNKSVSSIQIEILKTASPLVNVDDVNSNRGQHVPERRPLGPRSQNTPHRIAPPPPKMSVLEAATATAGAATASKAKMRRANIKIREKTFTRLEVLGRGGSSKVYKVMAENGTLHALKRVSLEDADDAMLKGYMGEIDLLEKLKTNDRVVTLYDWEVNEEKQTLSVLMEMGDLDFNSILDPRIKGEAARFDPSFTRHYWKEMLECIQAVHDHDIVHSDLKPANFVLVKGRLKLIDFGIANAIQTNETVNVHRETQIGTPNYMSPESLLDANELPGAKGTKISKQTKIMKLGKPSDIWSLGVILYQVTYGRAPFGHIQNPISRCRAIIDWNYAIDFPSVGLGGVLLPKGLIRTMQKCLNRNQHERPTAQELLDFKDPFLYPTECDEGSIVMTEELLGRILQNAAAKLKDRTPSDAELLSLWPAGYFASLRKGMA